MSSTSLRRDVSYESRIRHGFLELVESGALRKNPDIAEKSSVGFLAAKT